MDTELKFLRGITTRLPGLPGAGVLANRLSEFYSRKKRDPVDCECFGVKMTLDPSETVERGLLFFPQLYERRERRFLQRTLKAGSVFLDIGANVGFYSLIASQMVGRNGKVIAFEADPQTFECLQEHSAGSGNANIVCINAGVSDRLETLQLTRSVDGNRGGNSFLTSGGESVPVRCEPLLDFLKKQGITRVDALKIDIEGMEYRVLRHFFERAPVELWPRAMVVEDNPTFHALAGGDLAALVSKVGYRVEKQVGLNLLLQLNQT